MDNLEAGIRKDEQVPVLRGREALSTMEALGIQITLMQSMVPDALKQYLGTSDGEHVGLEDKLFERWAGKYSIAFKDFCDENAEDVSLIERIKTNALVPEDIERMSSYMQGKDKGGLYFKDNVEIAEFPKLFVH